MIEERRNTRRELLGKLLTLGPLAALAAAFGVNGAKKAEAAYDYYDLKVQNKLGVGTDNPVDRLHVVGPGDDIPVRFDSPNYATVLALVDTYPTLKPAMTMGVNPTPDMFIGANYWGSGPATIGLIVGTLTGGSSVLAMKITGDGKVGIGTPTPAYRLDVVGDIRLTGVLEGAARKTYYDA